MSHLPLTRFILTFGKLERRETGEILEGTEEAGRWEETAPVPARREVHGGGRAVNMEARGLVLSAPPTGDK